MLGNTDIANTQIYYEEIDSEHDFCSPLDRLNHFEYLF